MKPEALAVYAGYAPDPSHKAVCCQSVATPLGHATDLLRAAV